MPLKLVAPRDGKSPNYTIRGTYLGVRVDTTSGTDKRQVALAQLKKLEGKIERGEYPPIKPAVDANVSTFASAALAYMEAGCSKRWKKYLAKLVKHFRDTPLAEIGQAAIDEVALTLCPNVTSATRNTCVYTPVSAVLHNAGIKTVVQPNGERDKIRRPRGAKGREITDHLSPEDAQAILLAADDVDPELGVLCRLLLYTGCRLNEALALRWEKVSLDESYAFIGKTKNGDPRSVRLRADLVAQLRAHREAIGDRERVFRFHQGGHLKYLLVRAKLQALGIACPVRRPRRWRPPTHRLAWANFHSFRHTFATWFRRYGGGDVEGLVATGNWRDARSARRYAHVVPREEWHRVEDMPTVGGKSVEKARDTS